MSAARRVSPVVPLVVLWCAGCTPRVLTPGPVDLPAAWRTARVPERQLVLGRSVEGVPLVLSVFGNGGPVVLVIGGIHGDEPASADLARRLVAYVRAHPEIAVGRTVAILPAANPDGLAAGTRTNARGVDLNRNFPASNWRPGRAGRHGVQPASEPETRAILAAIRRFRPACLVALHAISRGRQCNNYDGPARELAALLAGCNGYPVRADMGYPTPGSLGSWAGRDRGIPTVTLELPRSASVQQAWEENGAGLLALLRTAGSSVAR